MKQKPFTKKCLLATLSVLAPFISMAQWATSGGNIYNTNAGSVGIGTTAPSHKLEVVGDAYVQGTTTANGNFIVYGGINWQNSNTMACYGNKTINLNGNNWNFWNGKVGIGTVSPTEQLEVGGNISLTAAASRRIYMGGQGSSTFGLSFSSTYPDFGIFYTEGSPDVVRISPNGNSTNGTMNIFGDGRVGIGTNTPSGALDVNGQAKMTSASVNTTLQVGTQANIGSVPGGNCPNATLNVGTASSPAIYAYSTDATIGTGVFSTGQRVGLYGIAGQLQTCPTSIYGNVGVNGEAHATAGNDPTGISGFATGGSTAIGIAGYAYNGTAANYGVFGAVSGLHGGTPDNWAGYFVGDVQASGNFYGTSDRKLKNNIKPVEAAMDKLMALKPSSYTFRTEEYKQLSLPEGEHMGLIAQELEQVFPALVRNSTRPEIKDKNGKVLSEKVDYKCVNYTELIPVLIAGIQEQQTAIKNRDEEIQSLKNEIAEIKSAISRMTTGTSVPGQTTNGLNWLEQTIPNPTGSKALVTYHLAGNITRASIVLYTTEGIEVKRYAVEPRGTGSITIDAAELQNGTYIYSLVTNDGIADTKKMTVTR